MSGWAGLWIGCGLVVVGFGIQYGLCIIAKAIADAARLASSTVIARDQR